jgi:DNA-binding winged helix-turn-helix (wHTH) protein
MIRFGPFRLDSKGRGLRRDDRVISLRPKSFQLLTYMTEHPGRLLTKDELLDAGWGKTAVSDGVLKVCIWEIREALGDDPAEPRYVQTVHRAGYRFIEAKRAPRQSFLLPCCLNQECYSPITPSRAASGYDPNSVWYYAAGATSFLLMESGAVSEGYILVDNARRRAEIISHPLVGSTIAWVGGSNYLLLRDPRNTEDWFTSEFAKHALHMLRSGV